MNGRAVVSHISRKTSEIWGTQGLFAGRVQKPRQWRGLDPLILCSNSISDVRSWSPMSGIEHPWSIDGVKDYWVRFSPVWSRWRRWKHLKWLVRRRPWSAGR